MKIFRKAKVVLVTKLLYKACTSIRISYVHRTRCNFAMHKGRHCSETRYDMCTT